ncbi:39S ribosomal protein L22, mitochondrial isoform X2 [Neodiprion fabricii]|uniref:39S ribosomal protein L22, mitochondrial isoform X2 n=1 Tax=Neodiprion fabricii TaxID=2872261 RepID=UPI001ED8EC58|nr:39S ribosomal protein L22, mitochondrial isoform X2 [Neodiprion fabricii]
MSVMLVSSDSFYVGLRMCTRWLGAATRSINKQVILLDVSRITGATFPNDFHTTAAKADDSFKIPHWLQYNKKIYPPQALDEEPRKAFVCHMKSNIKYPPKKMWYVAVLVRGMTVDEAIKQLSFVLKKGAAAAKETILEAQQMAVEQHNVEFKSNLWVAESFVGKGMVYKGLRRHAKGRPGMVHYRYCHYYVRLEEGKPPENYYLPAPKSKQEMLDDWLTQMRQRKITSSL